MVAGDVLVFGIPVLLGRTFFRTARDLRLLMVSVALAGLLYSLPTLFEIRMSPMLNYWVYGYSQHSWAQAKRFGGWRPMVFMAHGLALALFLAITAIVATSVARARRPLWRIPARPAAVWIATVLVLCKSTGAILLGAVFVPFAALARSRTMLRVAVAVAVLVSLYPMARAADLVPTDALVEGAAHISEERAASLRFRFENEAALLDRARERLVFGWGGYGRNRVFRDTLERSDTVPDGFWIIILGIHGVAGLACFYGLVFTPVVQAWRHGRRAPPGADRYLLGGLSLAVAVYVIDTIPNGLFTNLPVFLAGALSGVAPAVARAARSRRAGAGASRRAAATPPRSPRGERPARRGATTREVREATYRRRHLD
jgi:hypothetical protein